MTDVSDDATVVTDQDIQDFMDAGGKEPDFHPILEVWREVLKPAAKEAEAKISPNWAVRISGAYREVNYAHMPEFQARYFGLLLELAEVINTEIATDDQCLTWTTPEEDVEHNSGHYKNILRDWQLAIMRRELNWNPTSPYAGVEVAVLSEIHKLFFANGTGITAFLDNIRFEFTDADQANLAAALDELRLEVLGGADE